MKIDRLIASARESIPAAFQHDRTSAPDSRLLDSAELVADATPLDSEFRLDLPESQDQLSDSNREDAGEAEAVYHELGLEIFAFYRSFHQVPPGQKWGIFYYREGIRRFALILLRDFSGTSARPELTALQLLRLHERYHFRVDLSTLYDEMLLKSPLYNRYSHDVYRKVWCTSECYEESLANRTMVQSWLRTLRDPIIRVLGFGFIQGFCKNGPLGYRDFDRPAAPMRERLLGRIRTGNASGKLPGAEREWLGLVPVTNCPQYIIPSSTFPKGRFLKCRHGGRVWFVHRNDADKWPSDPHAHDYEHREKLHLGDGHLFSTVTRQCVGSLRRKDFEAVCADIASRFPNLQLPIRSV